MLLVIDIEKSMAGLTPKKVTAHGKHGNYQTTVYVKLDSDKENVYKKLIDTYGTTDDPTKIGFILPNGKGINLGGLNSSGRSFAHSTVSKNMGELTLPAFVVKNKLMTLSVLGNEIVITHGGKYTDRQINKLESAFKQTGRRDAYIEDYSKMFMPNYISKIKNATFEDVYKHLKKNKKDG